MASKRIGNFRCRVNGCKIQCSTLKEILEHQTDCIYKCDFKPKSCSFCDACPATNLIAHMKVCQTKRTYCTFCNESFHDRQSFLDHYKSCVSETADRYILIMKMHAKNFVNDCVDKYDSFYPANYYCGGNTNLSPVDALDDHIPEIFKMDAQVLANAKRVLKFDSIMSRLLSSIDKHT